MLLGEPQEGLIHVNVVVVGRLDHGPRLFGGETHRGKSLFELVGVALHADGGDETTVLPQPDLQVAIGIEIARGDPLVELGAHGRRQAVDLAAQVQRPRLSGFPNRHAGHQYLRGRAMPAGAGMVYSTTSTPCAVSLESQVSVSSPSTSTRPRSRK